MEVRDFQFQPTKKTKKSPLDKKKMGISEDNLS